MGFCVRRVACGEVAQGTASPYRNRAFSVSFHRTDFNKYEVITGMKHLPDAIPKVLLSTDHCPPTVLQPPISASAATLEISLQPPPPPPGTCFNFHSDGGGLTPPPLPWTPSPPPPSAPVQLKNRVWGTF